VHIQISIDPNTNAQKFAWLVPIAQVPEFEVGSQPLFDALLNASVPTYQLNQTFEQCGENGLSGGLTTNASGAEDSGGLTGSGTDGGEPAPEDPVVFKTTAGAFEIVVLADKQIAPIKQWLIDNDYQWIDGSETILQQYLDENNVIVALKLAAGADEGDVHPIVLRYPGNENCFPLRLTRFASVENMDIRVFMLGAGRGAPTNYRHVLVNPLKIDWLSLATNYKEVISKAVDELQADGLAFVTEYAGPSNVVAPFAFNFFNPSWNEATFVGLPPAQVVAELNNQGLANCWDPEFCSYNHPLVEGVLKDFLPVPDGLTPGEFYSNLQSYADQIDLMVWGDGSEFAKALADRVIAPGMHAQELIDTHEYLTRMYTVISPNEMIADPIFHVNPELPEVANLRVATEYNLCDGNSVVTLPDEREIYVPNGGPWPDFIGEMFWAEEIQQVALKGKPMHLVNNTAVINQKIEEWNLAHGWPRFPAETGGPTTSASDTDSGGPDSATSGGQDDNSGCGCRSDEGPGAAALALAGLALLAGRRRRR
jgi:MYXO-CTERM domain-containing protein